MTTIISLNVALFTMFPVATEVLQLSDEEKNKMLLHRRDENVKVILSYIRS